MNGLCKNYYKMIMSNFNEYNPIIIYYGSNIYNESSSDLDICLIFEHILNDDVSEKLIEKTKEFQKDNGLKIDEEIPFTNKLVYTIDEVEDIFINSPFVENGIYKLDDIVKTKDFLSSNIMKKRLMLNILTTDHKVLNDKNKKIRRYERKAWMEILSMLKNVFGTNLLDVDQVLDNMYVNPKTHYGGEMYLGYKLANPKKKRYLKRQVKRNCKIFIKCIDKQ